MTLRSQRLLFVALLGLALYASGELLDGSPGTVPELGLGDALGGDGLLALPATLALGSLLAGLAAGAGALLAMTANRRAPTGAPAGAPLPSPATALRERRPSPLAAAVAGRAPPRP